MLDLFISVPVKDIKTGLGNTMLVDCYLYHSRATKKFQKIQLLIDTGATKTAVTRNTLQRLGYTKFAKGPTEKNTAAGKRAFDTTKISKLVLASIVTVPDLEVDALDWEDVRYHGIIGMDILSRLHFRSDTKLFELQNKPFETQPEEVPQTSPKRGVRGITLEYPTSYTVITDTEWVDNKLVGNVHSKHDSLDDARKIATELCDKRENLVIANSDDENKNTVLFLLESHQERSNNYE